MQQKYPDLFETGKFKVCYVVNYFNIIISGVFRLF
jgi:hypothetical protein